MAFAQPPTMATNPSTFPSTSPDQMERNDMFSRRSMKQLGLFFGGAAFFGLSSLITRRALVRRYAATAPKFYTSSNRPAAEVNGAMEAFDALTVATANVLSVGLMTAGGALWAFDISSVEDMRRKIRGGLGIDGSEGRESQAEQEMEEWLATVLKRKEEKAERKRDRSKDRD